MASLNSEFSAFPDLTLAFCPDHNLNGAYRLEAGINAGRWLLLVDRGEDSYQRFVVCVYRSGACKWFHGTYFSCLDEAVRFYAGKIVADTESFLRLDDDVMCLDEVQL